MTVLAVVTQAVSLTLMWRIWRIWRTAAYSTPAEDGGNDREGTEASAL